MKRKNDEILYEDTIRETEIKEITAYIGGDVDKQISVQLEYPGLKSTMAAIALDSFMKEIEVGRVVRYGEDGSVLRPIYRNLLVDYKKYKILPWILSVHGKFKDIKFVASMSPTWNGVNVIFIFHKEKEYSPVVDRFEAMVKSSNIYKGKVFASSGEFIKRKELTLDDIYLTDETKGLIRDNILNFFSKKDIFKANQIPFRRGILLQGNPGTGKTYLGEILSAVMDDVSFIWAKAADMDYRGSFYSLAMFARDVAPAILFFEDIDHIDSKDRVIMSELLNILDGRPELENVLFITTCNTDELPPNLGDRPGRIDCKILFPLPDEDMRFTFLSRLLKDKNIVLSDEAIHSLAKDSEGLTPVHIGELVTLSIIIAIGKGVLKEDGTVKMSLGIMKEALQRINDARTP